MRVRTLQQAARQPLPLQQLPQRRWHQSRHAREPESQVPRVSHSTSTSYYFYTDIRAEPATPPPAHAHSRLKPGPPKKVVSTSAEPTTPPPAKKRRTPAKPRARPVKKAASEEPTTPPPARGKKDAAKKENESEEPVTPPPARGKETGEAAMIECDARGGNEDDESKGLFVSP
jgi:hypothetical protein